MAKRTLKRQLSLVQTIMLGTAGTLGSGIFVLTGHAAAVAGPAAILAIIIGGILSFAIAFNYCELATTYPETGGAMTYVREAWGKGLLAFLVGSMDSISSTFYTALSAVGFAYSASVFIPSLPIVPVAIATIVIFSILNILGVTKVGNVQLVMGAGLIFAFLVYIIGGFVSPSGFHPQTLLPNGRFFTSTNPLANIGVILRTLALIYAAYVGFEVIADDAEEVTNPTKNIPIAIIVSLILITVIYSLTVTVALGTTPYTQLAGSSTALSDTVRKFFPGLGVIIIGIAGMVGALTSVNSSMLSATRETFTLSRDGAWPAFLSRLNQVRVPFMAIITIGAISILITSFGWVDFLSYLTSAGYLFVLFFSNLAMITLHRKYPYLHRPFKAPLFPLTPIVASLTCLVIIVFSEWKALLFTGSVILLFTLYYFIRLGLHAWFEERKRSLSPGRYRLVVPYQPNEKMDGVVKLGAMLAKARQDTTMCILQVMIGGSQDEKSEIDSQEVDESNRYVLRKFINYAVEENVPIYSKFVTGESLSQGVLDVTRLDNNVQLVIFRWPQDPKDIAVFRQTIEEVTQAGLVNIGVLYDKGVHDLKNILVPVGGGYHCRLAIHIGDDLTATAGEQVDYLRVVPKGLDQTIYEDQMAYLQEIVMTELEEIPGNVGLHISESDSAAEAIVDEAKNHGYDLIIIGSYEGKDLDQPLFGELVEKVRLEAPCSTLIVRHYETRAASWLRRQLKSKKADEIAAP
ncbi:MAG: amino acid permease [Anaerolineaceae bacterium]|nr:amino acid permease [Anaerolineaceae bacterium]